MHVAVTGGAGFIGAHVVRALEASPDVRSVSVIDDLSTGAKENLDGLDARLVVGSILDADALDEAVRGADAVVHLAARPSVPRSLADPAATNAVNVTGTLNVLEAARRDGAHVVVASSSSVYGANPAMPKHEDLVPMPLSPYGVSKLAAESYTVAYRHSFALPVLPFRFFNVFGPGQTAGHAYAAVIPTFVDAALRGEPLPVDGDGRQTRDFTFVGTVAAVLVQAVVRRVTTVRPVNLAFGTRTDLLTLIGVLERTLGRPLEVVHRPPRTGDVRASQADDGALRRLFPEVEPVPLAEGLEATVAWMQGTRPLHDPVPAATAADPAL